MSHLKEDLFRKLVRELIKQELDEANSTASAGGEYSTPHAFKGSNKKGRKNITKKFDVETMCQSNLKEYRRLIKN